MNINFRAQKLGMTKIKKLNKNKNRYIPQKVAFIKFDLNTIEDKKALKNMDSEWPYTFARSINKSILKQKDAEVYALTLQNDSFEKIETNKILGLAEIVAIEDTDSHFLEYMQIHPDYAYKKGLFQRDYKNIGTALLNSIKKLDFIKKISTNSLFSAIDFYKTNCFDINKDNGYELIWEKLATKKKGHLKCP